MPRAGDTKAHEPSAAPRSERRCALARRGPGVALVTLLALGAGLVACQRRGAAPPAQRLVRDGFGRELRLPEHPERVVSLAPSSTEILYAVGAGATLVGVDRYSDHPPEAKRLAQVGANIDPSFERIVALRPAVVFTATSANTQATAEGLERLGLPVYVSRVVSLGDIFRDIAGIGEAVGRAEAGRQLAEELRARADRLAAHYGAAKRVRVLVVVWPEPLVVAGRASHIADLVRAAGGENVADDANLAFPSYSVERVIARAPEVLLVGRHAVGAPPPLGTLERLESVPAVRQRRIYTIDADLVFRPGPRVVEAIEVLGRLLHPELPPLPPG